MTGSAPFRNSADAVPKSSGAHIVVSGGRPIALTGFMASGKSTIGKLLASSLGLEFMDLDLLIERKTGTSVAEIFSRDGEAAFRKLELSALAECTMISHPFILACGGGMLTLPEARSILARSYLRIWLDCPLEVILDRLVSHDTERCSRPLASGRSWESRLAALYEDRREIYKQNCDIAFDIRSGESAEESALRLSALVRGLAS
ncbi:MAG TPA: shikimate kinase [Rectinemataceae bacterium]